MPQKTWTKEKLIKQLQAWHESGVPVDKLWRQDPGVTSRATAVFGTWRTAMGAAGFKSPRERWSRERILRELKQRNGNRRTNDRKLESAAGRYFGSVREALRVAGLPVRARPPAHRDWTRQNAIEAIRKRGCRWT